MMSKVFLVVSIISVYNALGQPCPGSIYLNTFSQPNPAINDLGQTTLHDQTLSKVSVHDNRLILENIPGQSGYWVSDIDTAGCRNFAQIKYVELVWSASVPVSVEVSLLTGESEAHCAKRLWLSTTKRTQIQSGLPQTFRFPAPDSMDFAHAVVIGIPRVQEKIQIMIDSILLVPECLQESEAEGNRGRPESSFAEVDDPMLKNGTKLYSDRLEASSCWKPASLHVLIAIVAIVLISLQTL